MSISDLIVVMQSGVLQQSGRPQDIYDDPVNLFVAKFLGTPPINVFDGRVKAQRLMIGDAAVMDAPGVKDMPVHVGVRPEGFVLKEDGPLVCALSRVEVMGRDTSIVSTHPAFQGTVIRAIINSENQVPSGAEEVRFALKPRKVFLFDRDSEKRIPFPVG